MIDLLAKYQNQMSLFLLFFYVSTVNLFCFIGNMLVQLIYFALLEICKELIGYISVSIMFTFG